MPRGSADSRARVRSALAIARVAELIVQMPRASADADPLEVPGDALERAS